MKTAASSDQLKNEQVTDSSLLVNEIFKRTLFAFVSLLYWALDMSNKTDFCCDSLPNAIELPRRGEGEKIFSPLCVLLTGHVKIEILIPTVD